MNPKLPSYELLCTHHPAKCPPLPSAFSTWNLHRCTPPPAGKLGHTASACYPVSEPVLHTACTAAMQAGVGTSCSFLENICPDPPFLSWVSSDITHLPKSPFQMTCVIFGNHHHHLLLTTDVNLASWDMCGNVGRWYDHWLTTSSEMAKKENCSFMSKLRGFIAMDFAKCFLMAHLRYLSYNKLRWWLFK